MTPLQDRSEKTVVQTPRAPEPVGGYSQAIRCSGFVFVSGQGPFVPGQDDPIGSDIATQTEQTLHNIAAILESAGIGMQDVVKATIYLSDLSHFSEFDRVYRTWFEAAPPARATIGCELEGFLVEIDVIACCGSSDR
ncbi:MAG: RidA family protein [Actinobacteria bacterium]|nr:RidA family protein [Actinomycetota bacterium]